MMKDVEIRPIRLEELDDVLGLYQEINDQADNTLSMADARALYQRITSYPDYQIYVATMQGRIIGTFALLIMDNLGHGGACSGVLEDMAVDPRKQGLGIGRAMVQFAMEQCRAKRCYKLMLSSNIKREQAHSFYEKLGFEKHGFSYSVSMSE